MEPIGTQLKILGMCINRNVIIGLAVVGLAVWWLAPSAVAGVLPLLLVAACPLSMLIMMKVMMRTPAPDAAPVTAPVAADVAADKSADSTL